MIRRWGLTVPLDGISLADHARIFRSAEALGYTDFWSYESDVDPFVPLAIAAGVTERAMLGTAIVGAFTRGPAIIAMGAQAMAEAAPGRFCLGIGAGSNVTVERWNGGQFDKPLARVTDTVQAVRQALDGQTTNVVGRTLSVSGFRLTRPVPARVPIYVAGLQERMVRQAVRISDGVITNWLSAGDVGKIAGVVRDEARAVEKDPASIAIACRIFVCPTNDRARAREMFKRAITAYLNVPVYRRFQAWLGREEVLREMHVRWDIGDRKGALAAVPEETIDDLVIVGSPEECRAGVQAYCDNGVTIPIIRLMNLETEPAAREAETLRMIREAAPAR
ncbi:MAG: LLM class F420-dependent oxidoreductase [Candidatus Rokubacteria bacterium]|nr:LLM class F420-dependent oxidoreductase [Candidatus Rokubacteria bacterium]